MCILLHDRCELVETMLLIISKNAKTLVPQRIYIEIINCLLILFLLLNMFFLLTIYILLIMFFTLDIHEYKKLLFNKFHNVILALIKI
jgi:hypothetical protein